MKLIWRLKQAWINYRAARRIPAKVLGLLASINSKYHKLSTNTHFYQNSSLDFLIKTINNDSEIQELNRAGNIGCIMEIRSGEKSCSGCMGVNLCFGRQGLYIYSFNDFQAKSDSIPASSQSISWFDRQLSAECLRQAIVDYTTKDNYVRRVADFRMFQPAPAVCRNSWLLA